MNKFQNRIIEYTVILFFFFIISSNILASQGYIPDCSVDVGIPVPAGFPNENTTGIKGAGLTYSDLTPYSGTYTISGKSDFVLERMDIDGVLVIKNSDNITIRNCRVVGVALKVIRTQGTCSNITIENCEIRGSDEGVNEVVGVQWGSITGYFKIIKCDLSGAADGLKAFANTTVEGCYIHHLYRWCSDENKNEWTHNDCVQILGGNNIVLRGNTFLAPYQFSNAVMQCAASNNSIDNLLFENNYCSGGGWCVRFYDSEYGITNYKILNNVFEEGSYSVGAMLAEASPIIQCNTFVDGTPLTKNNTTCEAGIQVTEVNVSPVSLNLLVGQTLGLTATVLPENASDPSVIWSSDNTSIATVDANGMVTAITKGLVTITAATNDGGYTATCSINVSGTERGANTYYCDPVNGSMLNDGSKDTPWASLEKVFASGKTFNDGDVILLLDGNHGFPVIKEKNSANVTISKYAGNDPVIDHIQFNGASFWLVKDVKINPAATFPNQNVPLEHPVYPIETNSIVQVKNYSNNITFENCEIFSVENSSDWTTTDDWNYNAWNGVYITDKSVYIKVTGCHIKNVNFGYYLAVYCDYSTLEYTTIENIAGDGIRPQGSYAVVQYNTVKNMYNVNGNHDDLIQIAKSCDNGTIRGNKLINYTKENRPFKGPAQGIGAFADTYSNYIIENNLIVTNHYNGITFFGAKNCKIVNNTVVDLSNASPGPLWIQVSANTGGTPSSGNIIRNNLCSSLVLDPNVGTVENNIVISWSEYSTYFNDYINYDFSPAASSPAINNGLSDGAPLTDIDGNNRPQGNAIDVGCYEYTGDIIPVSGVSISSSDLTLEVGNTATLVATVAPEEATNKTVNWSSTDPLIAIVKNNGLVTAVSPGSTSIIATTSDGGFYVSCILTVTGGGSISNVALNKPVTVSSVTLSQDAKEELVDGDAVDGNRWAAEGFPQWAEVDLGANYTLSSIQVVTYQNRDYQYIIEARTENGQYFKIVDRSENEEGEDLTDEVTATARYVKLTVYGGYTYSASWCSINELIVNGELAPNIPVTGILLQTHSLSIDESQNTTLEATVVPTDATNKNVIWESSNPNIVSVNEKGLIESISTGTAFIKVIAEDGSFIDSCKVVVSKQSTFIERFSHNNSVGMFPNPFEKDNCYFTICQSEILGEANFRIIDLCGRIVYNSILFIASDKATIKLPIDLKQGIYLFILSNDKILLKNRIIAK